MVEPVTSLTAATIATLVATKAFEKTGEKVSESVWNLVGKLLSAIRKKNVTIATAIEAAAQSPQLSEQQIKGLTAKVEVLAATDPEIQQAAQAIQTAVQAQPGAIVNLTQLADKIGVVNQGTIINQTNTITL
ncbi:MAG: hypothetical protein HWQ38_00470 [Nostoc sp. NMS7]|uniref:hypothetical protein n=1 Tax=Nostoc sp. NMS7 TaxID=2815391 RepID=UPI0025E61492|nr:hypothetical protein [Nostoc sp. NMS7]MBN3945035.1 hypothetical protein [Nostoc sp. NMS7]